MIFADYPFPETGSEQAVALGFFDGVHLGHQALLSELRIEAEARALGTSVFTFADHPSRGHNPQAFPGLLQTQAERLSMLEKAVEKVFVAPVKAAVLNLDPLFFIREVLLKLLKARLIICGSDFRFGKNAAGTVETLAKHAAELGYEFRMIEDFQLRGDLVSSTRIRELVKSGKLEEAGELLGRPFSYKGIVGSGQRLGRRLGFPTVNLRLDEDLIIAALGVYASRVKIGSKLYAGISNLGYHPTVGRGAWPRLETYIYDFEAELYGQELEIDLLSYLRPEREFTSVEEMQGVVLADLEKVKNWHRKESGGCANI